MIVLMRRKGVADGVASCGGSGNVRLCLLFCLLFVKLTSLVLPSPGTLTFCMDESELEAKLNSLGPAYLAGRFASRPLSPAILSPHACPFAPPFPRFGSPARPFAHCTPLFLSLPPCPPPCLYTTFAAAVQLQHE